MKSAITLAVGLAVLVSGCAEEKFIGRPGLSVVQQQALPEPAAIDLVAKPRNEVLGPFDQISVDVFGLPEFSRTLTIDRSGHIALPLVGQVQASGNTPAELAQLVSQRLRASYVRDPKVTVNVTQVVSQVVTVGGQVKTPGLYPVTGQMTLMRAIARAQGFTDAAREDYVVVYRHVGEQEYVGLYDVRAIRLGLYPDPEIFANDVVEVDESRARRIFGLALTSTALLAAPLITLVR